MEGCWSSQFLCQRYLHHPTSVSKEKGCPKADLLLAGCDYAVCYCRAQARRARSHPLSRLDDSDLMCSSPSPNKTCYPPIVHLPLMLMYNSVVLGVFIVGEVRGPSSRVRSGGVQSWMLQSIISKLPRALYPEPCMLSTPNPVPHPEIVSKTEAFPWKEP